MLKIVANGFDVPQNTLGYRADQTITAITKFKNSKLGGFDQIFASVITKRFKKKPNEKERDKNET